EARRHRNQPARNRRRTSRARFRRRQTENHAQRREHSPGLHRDIESVRRDKVRRSVIRGHRKTEGQRDRGTERQRDRETEGQRDRETEGRRNQVALRLSVSLSLCLSVGGRRRFIAPSESLATQLSSAYLPAISLIKMGAFPST